MFSVSLCVSVCVCVFFVFSELSLKGMSHCSSNPPISVLGLWPLLVVGIVVSGQTSRLASPMQEL